MNEVSRQKVLKRKFQILSHQQVSKTVMALTLL